MSEQHLRRVVLEMLKKLGLVEAEVTEEHVESLIQLYK